MVTSLRRLGAAVLALTGVLAGLLVAAFAVAQTPPAKDQLSDYVAGTLSDAQRQAEIEQLGGFLPFDVRVGRVALRDDQGVWLEANDARVKLRPSALLKGEIHVEDAGVRRVALNHLPPPGPPAPPSSEPFRLPEPPQLPGALPLVRVDRLHVDSIELGAPVLGQAATFNLEGQGGTGEAGRSPQATLALRRTDQPTASLDLDARLDLAARRLGIRLEGGETGGLVAAATRQPQAGPLRLSLVGDGPLDDWRGRLLAEVERLARLETTLDLAYASTRRIRVDGAFTAAAGALPPTIAPVVGERVDLAVHAGETSPGVFALEQLLLKAGALSLTGNGTADVNADRLDGGIRLEIPALADLAGLAGVPLAGRAQVALAAAGRVAEPALRLDLVGEGIKADRIDLPRLGGGYDITLLRSAEGAIAGAQIGGTATTEGLALDGRELGTGGRVALELRAAVPPAGLIEVERVALQSSLAQLNLAGAVDRATLEGRLNLEGGIPDLAAVLALAPAEPGAAPPPLRGAVSLKGDATFGSRADRIDAWLTVAGRDLGGLPPGAAELLGPGPSLAAKALVEGKSAVSVEELRLEGTGVTLTGNPSLRADRSLAGALELTLPDLAPLEPVAKQPVSGRLSARAVLGGTLEKPAVALDATGEALRFGTQAIDRLSLAGRTADPLAAPAGDLTLRASRAGQDLALRADYALEGERLRLPRLELTGPATRLAGDLDVDLARTLASGRLVGAVADLGALSAWTQQQGLTGAVDLEAALSAAGGRQDGSLRATAEGVAGSFGQLGRASVNAAISDALGDRAALQANAEVADFAQPGLEVKGASLAADGPLTRLDLKLGAKGSQAAQPFDLRAEAEVAALGAAKSVLLESFGGKLAGQRIDLMAPARLSLDRGVLDLDQLDLKVGPAQIEGNLRYGNGRARGAVRLAALPLGMLESFGAPALEGTASGSLQLSGTTRAPSLTLGLDLRDVRPDGADATIPAADLDLDAQVEGGVLAANLSAAGLGAKPLVAEAGVPLRLSLEPFALELGGGTPLSGRIIGPLDLGRATALAALDGQTVVGTLNTDLRLGGSASQPSLDGTVTLRGGRIDDLTTGASLRDIVMTLAASGRRVELAELAAVDPHGGRIAGRGSASLDAAMLPTYDVALNLARARLLDSDLGVAILSGDISLDGGAGGVNLGARLRIDEGDLRIPAGGAVTILELDVIRKGEPEVAPGADAAPYPINLDVAVDAPGRLFVRGRGLESEWGGALKATGLVERPKLTGQLRFRRGFLDLLEQRFRIREATISLDGSFPPEPIVDLEATASTGEIEAVVRLTGPAADPELSLTSEPVLPQDEILSHVLFGRSKSTITPIQGVRLAAAVRELQGGGGADGVLDAVRRATGFDTIDVEGGATAAESSASVGKYINDRVYLQLQRGVQPGTGKARVEVELTPNLSVGTNVTETSQTGVDLQWRYDY